MSENALSKKFHKNLSKALTLEDAKFSDLLAVFNKAAHEGDVKEILAKVDHQDFGLAKAEFSAAIDAGFSYFDSDLDLDEVEERSESLAESVTAHLTTVSKAVGSEIIHSRLVSLIKAFSPLAKDNRIRDVMLHDERIYIEAVITPQIRPIFQAESESVIDSFVVVFNCQIRLLESTGKRDIHISMDLNDVNQLIDSLELAREQFEAMKGLLSPSVKIVTAIE